MKCHFSPDPGQDAVMLNAAPEQLVQEVEYPLASSGWHAIYLYLWKGGVTVRLTGDNADRYLRPDHDGKNPVRFQEVFWKCADLTDMEDGEGALHRDVRVDNIGGDTVNRWG